MTFALGETVGPYQLVEQLGQGGMATVFKAYHAALDRYVAIKVLHPAFMEDPNFLARFQREARVVARLEHPNIVPIYDFAEHQGRPYLVMKFIHGQTLKSYMADHQMSLGEIARIVEAVGDALAYAHQQDVLHRDIKPSNVMLANDGQIYLADFGLARIASSSTSSLTSDMMVGTPQYISPEQAQSKSNIDGRTDIYSFGVMLYEMLVGRVPFSADTPFAVIHDHIYTPLPMPRKINPRVPEGLERVLLKALAKDPDNRFATVTEMVTAFKMAVAGLDLSRIVLRNDLPPVSEWPPADRIQSRSEPLPAEPSDRTPTHPPAAPRQPVEKPAPPATSQPVPAPQPQTKPAGQSWLSPGRIGCCAGLAALVLVTVIAAAILLRQGSQRQAARATQTAAPVVQGAETTPQTAAVTPTAAADTPAVPSALPADVQQALNDALEAWQNGEMEQAAAAIRALYQATHDYPAQVSAVNQALESEDAWLLLCLYDYLNYDARPTAYTGARFDKLRMALYFAAEDTQAGPIFAEFQHQQLFAVPNLRHTLINGGDVSAAQSRINELLDNGPFVRRFPEILLLDAEFAIEVNDSERAQIRLTTLMNRKDVPEWVMALARELKNEIP